MVISIVQCRSYQFGHACIGYYKTLCFTLFNVKYLGYERTALSHHRTSQSKMYLLFGAQLEIETKNFEITFKIGYWNMIGMVVINAKSATHIDMFHRNTFCAKLPEFR